MNDTPIFDMDQLNLWLQSDDISSFEPTFNQDAGLDSEMGQFKSNEGDEYDLQQEQEKAHEKTSEEDMDMDIQVEKKKRNTQLHNLNERNRRQRLNQRFVIFQKMIPNCKKRDIASILEEGIKYIAKLQKELEMMITMRRLACSMFPSPLMMMPQPGQQGIPIPPFAPFLQPHPLGYGMGMGMGMGMRMGMTNMPAPFNFGMSPLGLPNPTSLPTLNLPAPGEIFPSSYQYPWNVSEFMPSGVLYTNTKGDETGPSNAP